MQSKQIYEYLRSGKQSGFQRRRAATYTNYECADGRQIAIAANSQEMWERMVDALDDENLANDHRFKDLWGRANHKDELVSELDRVFRQRPMTEWLEPLELADVPHAPVLDYAGMSEHPQYWENGYLQKINSPHLGLMRVPGLPIQMSVTPPRIQGSGPPLGMHTEEILLSAGLTWDEIEILKDSGATRTS